MKRLLTIAAVLAAIVSPQIWVISSKPMNTDNTLTSELDHWIFLHLPKSMKQAAGLIRSRSSISAICG